MKYIQQLVIILYWTQVTTAVPSLTVASCSRQDITFNIVDGIVGGVVYIETTTSTSTDCIHPISNGASEAYTTVYSTCGATPDELDSGRQIELLVVVQNHAAYNVYTDSRFKVVCTFVIGQVTTNDVVITSSNDPTGNLNGQQVEHTVSPRPQLKLYSVDASGAQTPSSNDVVTMGQDMILKIDLVDEIPDVEFVVHYCYIDAIVSGQTLATLDIFDETTHCPVHDGLFNEFVYTYTDPGLFPVAISEFQAPLPSLPSVKLQSVSVNTRYVCRVELCLTSLGGCTYPSCSAARRRRDTDTEESGNSTQTFTLTDNVNVYLGELDRNSVNPTQRGINSVCFDKSDFWIVLLSLLALLLLVITATCVFFCVRRKRRQNDKETALIDKEDTTTMTPVSTLTLSTDTSDQILSKGPMLRFLPRFVSVDQQKTSSVNGTSSTNAGYESTPYGGSKKGSTDKGFLSDKSSRLNSHFGGSASS